MLDWIEKDGWLTVEYHGCDLFVKGDDSGYLYSLRVNGDQLAGGFAPDELAAKNAVIQRANVQRILRR